MTIGANHCAAKLQENCIGGFCKDGRGKGNIPPICNIWRQRTRAFGLWGSCKNVPILTLFLSLSTSTSLVFSRRSHRKRSTLQETILELWQLAAPCCISCVAIFLQQIRCISILLLTSKVSLIEFSPLLRNSVRQCLKTVLAFVHLRFD